MKNSSQNSASKSTGQILKDYIFTLFNFFNFAIAVALAVAGAFSSLLFLAVVVLNITIGVVQEVKSRNLINKLSIMIADKATVVRGEKQEQLLASDIVVGDIVVLKAGEQIAVDSVLLEGELEVNEALLTGESDALKKKMGDMLLSGSFVVSGVARVKVTKIGQDGYAAKLTQEAKKAKAKNSELVNSMRKITKLTSFIIVPVGVLLFVQAMFFNPNISSWQQAVPSVSAALLGMLPRGLLLLVSIALTSSNIRLAKKRILVQDLYASENLARVNILCLDKTGTITEGKMKIVNQKIFSGLQSSYSVDDLMRLFLTHSDDNNVTARAMREYFLMENGEWRMENDCLNGDNKTNSKISQQFSILNSQFSIIKKIPFSSDRKYSSVTIKDIGTIVVGAPEVLQKFSPQKINYVPSDPLNRVLFVGFAAYNIIENGELRMENGCLNGDNKTNSKINPQFSSLNSQLNKNNNSQFSILNSQLKIIAALELADPIRSGAKATFAFFKKEGVKIKVISGDNAKTVSLIAQKAGIENADKFIDLSTIPDSTDLSTIAHKYTVFGRVSPKQKQMLVMALKMENGEWRMENDCPNSDSKTNSKTSQQFSIRDKHKKPSLSPVLCPLAPQTVGFVGDGVNDILALREADCSIALANGSGASKQISSIVLLDSDFTHLPSAVLEGRRVINNMTRAGGIFFVKTIYSVILSLLLVVLNMPFPFLPVQITLIDLVIEGFPSFFLSFEKQTQKPTGSFLTNALTRALPFAIMVIVACCVLFVVGRFLSLPYGVLASLMYITLGFISVVAAVRACLPPNRLRVFLMLATSIGYFLAVWLFSYGISLIFSIDFNLLELYLPLNYLWIAIVLSVATVPFLIGLVWLFKKSRLKKGFLLWKRKNKKQNI